MPSSTSAAQPSQHQHLPPPPAPEPAPPFSVRAIVAAESRRAALTAPNSPETPPIDASFHISLVLEDILEAAVQDKPSIRQLTDTLSTIWKRLEGIPSSVSSISAKPKNDNASTTKITAWTPSIAIPFLQRISKLHYLQPLEPLDAEKRINAVVAIMVNIKSALDRSGPWKSGFLYGDDDAAWTAPVKLGLCGLVLVEMTNGLDASTGRFEMQLAAVSQNLLLIDSTMRDLGDQVQVLVHGNESRTDNHVPVVEPTEMSRKLQHSILTTRLLCLKGLYDLALHSSTTAGTECLRLSMILLSEAMTNSGISDTTTDASNYTSVFTLLIIESLLGMSVNSLNPQDTWMGLDLDESLILVERMIDVALLDIWSNENTAGGTGASTTACRILSLETVYKTLLSPEGIVLLHRLVRGLVSFLEKMALAKGQKLQFYWACTGLLCRLLISGWFAGNDVQKKAILGVLSHLPKSKCDCPRLAKEAEISIPTKSIALGEVTYMMHDFFFDFHKTGCRETDTHERMDTITNLLNVTFGIQ
ncbi:hypothetical protein HDV05_007796 [Chytridiales sp. JEL 0842]|nr:hypothetical protein HDV05_007796 [Chytridiales sp. JEL 0842]